MIRARTPNSVSYLKMPAVLRMGILKVMYENNIDVFVNPRADAPPYKLGEPASRKSTIARRSAAAPAFTALLGGPEMDVPQATAGCLRPQYVLTPTRGEYIEVTGDVAHVCRIRCRSA